jgi:hypothetical protein
MVIVLITGRTLARPVVLIARGPVARTVIIVIVPRRALPRAVIVTVLIVIAGRAFPWTVIVPFLFVA